MRIGPLFTIALFGFCFTECLASDVRILSLPDTVVGTWAPNENACKGPGDQKLSIAAKQHSTADATCEIAWITVTASRDGPAYSARSNCTKAKGGKKEPPSYLVVSPRPDGKLLVRMPSASHDSDMATYQKCL
jgi:hypothetical protein